MAIQSYEDLETWQIAMELVVSVYGLSSAFPPQERYGLTAQLRRAAVSIPSNIAEGHQRGSKSYLHFIATALGSNAEVQTQLRLAIRLEFVDATQAKEAMELAERTGQLLHGLKRALERRVREEQS